jgi:hypothetical protein
LQFPKINYLLGQSSKAWRLFFAENNGVSKDMLSIINEGAWQWDYQNKINFYSRGLTLPLLR